VSIVVGVDMLQMRYVLGCSWRLGSLKDCVVGDEVEVVERGHAIVSYVVIVRGRLGPGL
jgi:hypothetical protein